MVDARTPNPGNARQQLGKVVNCMRYAAHAAALDQLQTKNPPEPGNLQGGEEKRAFTGGRDPRSLHNVGEDKILVKTLNNAAEFTRCRQPLKYVRLMACYVIQVLHKDCLRPRCAGWGCVGQGPCQECLRSGSYRLSSGAASGLPWNHSRIGARVHGQKNVGHRGVRGTRVPLL